MHQQIIAKYSAMRLVGMIAAGGAIIGGIAGCFLTFTLNQVPP
jgi:hypothetical protein